jgi:hypothetical protein
MQRELRHTYLSTLSASNVNASGSSVCRVCSDVMLLGFWAAMVPAFLWIGHAAGF